MPRAYIAIDLKSFYASVECANRKLDPLTTNLVVADQSRTDKTICLAVSPALKGCGIPGRPRLFEVVQKMRQFNVLRQRLAPQQANIGIKNRMGKNAILKGTNFVEGATGKERNEQIGGHRK